MHNKQTFFIPQSYSFMVYDVKKKKKKDIIFPWKYFMNLLNYSDNFH